MGSSEEGDGLKGDPAWGDGEDELMSACHVGDSEGVKRLLSDGVDAAYFETVRGLTPLMVASAGGHAECVKLLLEAGAPWMALDRESRCAGEMALANGHQACVDLILEEAVRAELLFAAMSGRGRGLERPPPNADYLSQRVEFSDDGTRILDTESEAVMMAWEGPLMERHAEVLCGQGGRDVLNVGFGLGMVDRAIQGRGCRTHTIVEAHPEVHRKMLKDGWGERPGVRVLYGRWQDILGAEAGDGSGPRYDAVFFDTYGEYYDDMRDFHALLPKLLRPGGTYSFFNGLAPHNVFFHAVCCQVADLELQRLGFDPTVFTPVPVDADAHGDATWDGVTRRYWYLDHYYLPDATFRGTTVDE